MHLVISGALAVMVFLPMDESLVNVALDFGGRFYLDFKAKFPENQVGDLPCDMVPHVFYSLAEHMKANLHITVTGDNTHHMVEACLRDLAVHCVRLFKLKEAKCQAPKVCCEGLV